MWWEENRSVSYCLPCAGAAAGAGQNDFCSENRRSSDDIEPAALKNESLDEERSDNIEPAYVIQARMKGFKAVKKE